MDEEALGKNEPFRNKGTRDVAQTTTNPMTGAKLKENIIKKKGSPTHHSTQVLNAGFKFSTAEQKILASSKKLSDIGNTALMSSAEFVNAIAMKQQMANR